MQLTHTFTVPVGPDEAWGAFADIGSVAACFPGAVVTSVEGDEFEGTCKVKLGPVALQYAGSGRFLERDENARRMVVEAQGRDKRGNGTAGATVTATFTEEAGPATRVDVATDLKITGKPAQFGRGVMQDVSDKLLAQFVDCLESKVAKPADVAAAGADQRSDPSDPLAPPEPDAAPPPTAGGATAPAATPPVAAPDREEPEALDLGATVLPVLLRSYGRQAAAGLGVLVALVLLRRWRRRR